MDWWVGGRVGGRVRSRAPGCSCEGKGGGGVRGEVGGRLVARPRQAAAAGGVAVVTGAARGRRVGGRGAGAGAALGAGPARGGARHPASARRSPEVGLLRLLLEVEAHQRAADVEAERGAAQAVDQQRAEERRVDGVQDACRGCAGAVGQGGSGCMERSHTTATASQPASQAPGSAVEGTGSIGAPSAATERAATAHRSRASTSRADPRGTPGRRACWARRPTALPASIHPAPASARGAHQRTRPGR